MSGRPQHRIHGFNPALCKVSDEVLRAGELKEWRLKPLTTSQQVKVREMAGNGDPGVIGILTLAASIVTIDEVVWPFPKDRKELDMSLDVLDEKGLEAVAKAYEKFNEKVVETEEAAKNSPATDSSET